MLEDSSEKEKAISQTKADSVLDVVGGNDHNFILEWYMMNKITRRNERKAAQLENTKKKLKDIKIKPKS